MTSAISNALSGLVAATRRVDASASNIANTGSAGYQPVTTVQTANPGGGVIAVNVPKQPGIFNVDYAEETVNLKIAQAAYKANISVIKTSAEMEKDLLKTFDRKV